MLYVTRKEDKSLRDK